jgi:hypothetical protein
VARCGCRRRPGQASQGESRAPAVVGQVEPKLRMAITGANLWLVHGPGQTQQCVCDVILSTNDSTNRHGKGKALYGSGAAEGGRPGRDRKWTKLAERGARLAIDGFLGLLHVRLHSALGAEASEDGLASVGRHHPFLRVTETGLRRCSAGPSFEEYISTSSLTGTFWGTDK